MREPLYWNYIATQDQFYTHDLNRLAFCGFKPGLCHSISDKVWAVYVPLCQNRPKHVMIECDKSIVEVRNFLLFPAGSVRKDPHQSPSWSEVSISLLLNTWAYTAKWPFNASLFRRPWIQLTDSKGNLSGDERLSRNVTISVGNWQSSKERYDHIVLITQENTATRTSKIPPRK